MWVAAWMYVLHMCVCRSWKWVSHPGPWAVFDSDLFNALKIYSSHWSLSRAKKRMSRVSGESGLHGELQAMLDYIECDTLAQEKKQKSIPIFSTSVASNCSYFSTQKVRGPLTPWQETWRRTYTDWSSKLFTNPPRTCEGAGQFATTHLIFSSPGPVLGWTDGARIGQLSTTEPQSNFRTHSPPSLFSVIFFWQTWPFPG